jgi:hypothetical protein
MVAEDLYTGPAAPAVGELRRRLIDQIKSVLSSQPWTETLGHSACSSDSIEIRRAAWIIKEVTRKGIPEGRFAVRVVVPDPNPVGFPQVEARIVIDGMPIVAAAFDKGPAEDPERLIYSGQLRATSEPKEIRLAEAYCTEGCCGGLYVTIVREGPEVVWKNWRSSMPGDPPQEVRFAAAEYDREVARAEQDHSWAWPARIMARLAPMSPRVLAVQGTSPEQDTDSDDYPRHTGRFLPVGISTWNSPIRVESVVLRHLLSRATFGAVRGVRGIEKAWSRVNLSSKSARTVSCTVAPHGDRTRGTSTKP